MEEEADPVLEPPLTQIAAQRDQVIVVDPDQIVGFDQRLDRLREAIINTSIAGVEIALKLGQVDAIVEERPQRPVGVTVIIFVDILLFQVDGRGGDAAALLEVDMAGEFLGGLPRSAEPDAALVA